MKFCDNPTNRNGMFVYSTNAVKRKLTSQVNLTIRNAPGFESSMMYLRTITDNEIYFKF